MSSFQTWWNGREKREQFLLQFLVVFLTGFILYFVAVTPALNHRSELARQYQAATADLTLMRKAVLVAAVTENSEKPPVITDAQMRLTISQSAQAAGLTLTRLQPDQNSGLNVWLDSAESALFYDWALTLYRQHGIYVARASVQNSDADASVRVQVLFRNGSAS